MHAKRQGMWLLVVLAAAWGCSDDASGGSDGTGGSDAQSATDGAGGGDTDAGGTAVGGGGSDADTAVGAGGGGTATDAEVCDGVDNDGNGIIDDVDAGNDGICDCLHIGTIGRIGPWSDGGDIFAAWLAARSPIPPVEIGDGTLTEELLSTLDIIVVLRADTAPLAQDGSPAHHAFSDEEVAAMEAWVRGGGGLLTTIGYQGDEAQEVQNVNRLLAPLGLRYQDEGQYLQLDGPITWWADHPIANGVSQVRVVNGVEPDPAGGTVVARSDADQVAMVAAPVGDGHVIVFGDEWITYDSEWTNDTELQVELLWLNMFKWLTPSRECQVEIPPVLLE